jgi:hypothetical protein
MDPHGWQGVAFNQATASENKIHSDEVARRYGFRGGLVPGVTVYAYLVHPALASWGLYWLERGTATVALKKPLYDGGRFHVDLKADGASAYDGEVCDEGGVVCAEGRVALGDGGGAPARRGDAPVPAADARPEATRAALEALRERGSGAVHLRWTGEGTLERYTVALDDMPDLARPDRGGFAHPAFSLGLANTALAANVSLGPWIHVASEVRHHAAIPLDSALCIESRVTDLFARGGHEFVDLDVAVFRDDIPVLSASHRAIYRIRPAAQAAEPRT